MYYCDILKMKIPIDTFIILGGQGHLKNILVITFILA